MAGVQKNRDGLANGSKNLAGCGKIFFRTRRMESIVGLSWELATEACGRWLLWRCERVGRLASVCSSTGNIDVQSAIGLPNTAALIPCSSVGPSVKASIPARLPPMSSPQTPIFRVWSSLGLPSDEVVPRARWLLIQS